MKKQSIVIIILLLSIVSLSGCTTDNNTTKKEKIEYTGVIYDVVLMEQTGRGLGHSTDTCIYFNNGTKEIKILNDCDQYTVIQAYSLARNNIGKNVKIIYTKNDNQLTWFEVLE
jgi:hypothetical protein